MRAARADRRRWPEHAADARILRPIAHAGPKPAGTLDLERTLVLLKPDAVQRGLVGEIIGRFERKGLKLVGMKLRRLEESLLRQHYSDHAAQPFFAGLVPVM